MSKDRSFRSVTALSYDVKRETLIGRKRFDSYEQAVVTVTRWIETYEYDSSSFDHRYAGACQL